MYVVLRIFKLKYTLKKSWYIYLSFDYQLNMCNIVWFVMYKKNILFFTFLNLSKFNLGRILLWVIRRDKKLTHRQYNSSKFMIKSLKQKFKGNYIE